MSRQVHPGGARGQTAIIEAEMRGLIQDWRERRELEAKGQFTADEWKEIGKLPKAKKQLIAAELLMAGVNRRDTEALLHLKHNSIVEWIKDDPEGMQQLMNEAATRLAVSELPTTMNILSELRFSNNHSVSRKACLDMARAAGKGIDSPAPPTVTVNMNGTNNQFNLTTRELDEKITQLAAMLGPEAEKLAKGELSVKPIGLDAGRQAADGGGTLPDAPGTAPAAFPEPD